MRVFLLRKTSHILHRDHMEVQLFHTLNDLDRSALKQLFENISMSDCLAFT